MSFFDEADEPQPRQETRRSRTAGPPRARSGRPPGGSGPPPRTPQQQQIHNRRLIAVGVVVVLVILIAVLLAGSGGDSGAVKSYNVNVYRLVDASTTNANNVLVNDLAKGDLTGIDQDLTDAEHTALQNVAAAERLHAPSELASAQSALVDVMKMRQQALLIIATYTPEAASKHTSNDAVRQLAGGTGLLYGSDALYKTLVAPALAEALNGAGLTVGTTSGQSIYAGQVIPDLGWLNPTWIADKIGASLSTSQANANNDQPNLLHGDALVSTVVDGQTLQPGITNQIPAADAKDWALGVSDGGQTNELDVGCSIEIQSQSDAGTSSIPELTANGGTGTCNVHLPSTPELGPYTVTAKVNKVPGEKNLGNNTASYTVQFTG